MSNPVYTMSLFNNKGGVGKTTLSANIAHDFALRGDRVLYVDCDPQCNATQLMLTEEQTNALYASHRDPEESLRSSLANTVYGIFIPLREGEPTIDANIHTVRSERFKVDVLAGHPSLSQIEDVMSSAWQSAMGRETAAFRRIHWAGQLASMLEKQDRYDIIFFDVGPSLGPFNRTVLLGCDAFVTPTATDLFSFHAFGNLARWFEGWVTEYSELQEANIAAWTSYSSNIDEKLAPLRLHGSNGRELRYLGYTTLEYLKKKSSGGEQLIGAFERFRPRLPEEAQRMAHSLGQHRDEYLLGHIPHMFSMPATAQDAHAPIAQLLSKDGVRGTQLNQRDGYVSKIKSAADAIHERLMELPR